MRRSARWGLPALLCFTMLPGCTPTADSPQAGPSTAAAPTPLAEIEAVATQPEPGACYRLTLTEALAPSSAKKAVSCRRRWTARTIHVGRLDTAADGHLLAVDSARAQQRMAEQCPRWLTDYLGGTVAQLRLTVFRAVWFTPTLTESDAGADWFRCDLLALARPGELALLSGNLKGVLRDAELSAAYALCGTSRPGAPEFQRVRCAEEHTWRAVGSVDLDEASYPGPRAARLAGEQRCLEEARRVSADALDFQWGFEWPTRAQWAGVNGQPGQRYGVCWAPAAGS